MDMPRRGALQAGEKVQFTDRKGKKITDQLVAGGSTQTDHGIILHDDVIGATEGIVVTTVTSKREVQVSGGTPGHDKPKLWKAARAIGGWDYTVMRPRLADYVLSMPRGAQIMYPKDIAQVIQLGDIRSGLNVLESGAGSGAMSLNLLDAVGESGHLTTIEMRPEFAKIAEANATLYYGKHPDWWDLLTGDFDTVAAKLSESIESQGEAAEKDTVLSSAPLKGLRDAKNALAESSNDSAVNANESSTLPFDRIVLDMLDPWNRLEQAYRVIAPGGVLIVYITTTTQMSRFCEALREAGCWTEPEVQETFERTWKAQGLAVRPDHQMIGHTGFLIVTRAMAQGFEALHKRDRATKDTVTDIDSLTDEERESRLADLELRDISDHKLRKVLRDLGDQLHQIDPESVEW
ncbi:tRNA (adenine-N1)-methyltransferase [Bifidobacterium sp. ESL0775]|uniref:tRNA (adenine-N1)-methyltransferase n=1 Tax=Bifidobacterium sp. ESL0775 TaxID=2983230 RepID=UPI0023F87131|nr:tRNA (adenine-N1)-methyltransferase [Bifidobacterium sp. ESL0775]WEV68617.1 tRNA (adenine-N1)-methyltransferase [Bifidobacterium sp. ESL0775]